jgi:endo-1,4-beta-D-glucanase Y
MKPVAKSRIAVLLTGMVCIMPFAVASAQQPWPLWQSYIRHFADPQGSIVDHTGDGRTTSEGQAYAMFFALVANDREWFDQILGWTQTNLAPAGLAQSLPAWLWNRDAKGKWGIADRNSASDADVWMCYTLLQAGRLWSEPQYTDLGLALAKLIIHREVADLPHLGLALLPGEHGFHEKNDYTLNPSYVPPQLLRAIARQSPDEAWGKLAGKTALFLEKSASSGYAMDWVSYEDRKFSPTAGPGQLGGSYDAIRVYLWAGMMAADDPERASILRAYDGMAAYLKKHDVPPERVSPNGHVVQTRGSIGFSAAVLPYLVALGDTYTADKQRERLASQRNSANGLYGDNPTYYDQNLALFATGWEERRFRFDHDGQLQVAWSKP